VIKPGPGSWGCGKGMYPKGMKSITDFRFWEPGALAAESLLPKERLLGEGSLWVFYFNKIKESY